MNNRGSKKQNNNRLNRNINVHRSIFSDTKSQYINAKKIENPYKVKKH